MKPLLLLWPEVQHKAGGKQRLRGNVSKHYPEIGARGLAHEHGAGEHSIRHEEQQRAQQEKRARKSLYLQVRTERGKKREPGAYVYYANKAKINARRCRSRM